MDVRLFFSPRLKEKKNKQKNTLKHLCKFICSVKSCVWVWNLKYFNGKKYVFSTVNETER